MAVNVIMPKIGVYDEDIRLLAWRKAEGEEVTAGDVLFELETDKVTSEVEAEASGYLRRLAQEGDTVPIGTVVAVILDEDGPEPEAADEPPAAQSELFLQYIRSGPVGFVPPQAPTDRASRELRARKPAGKRLISPRARALIARLGLDEAEVGAIPSSGVRLTDKDIRAYVDSRPRPAAAAPAGGQLTGRRRSIAQRMVLSLQEAAQLTSVLEVDVTSLVRWREAQAGAPGFGAMFAFVCARALKRHPDLNATIEGDVVRVHPDVNMAIAVHTPEGVIAPVVHGADRLSLAEIDVRIRTLAERARADTLDLADLENGTFTLSSSGSARVDITTAIINPPQVAILWLGRIRQRPVVSAGALAVGETVNACLTFDHRVIDGIPAAEFLGTFQDLAAEIDHLV